MKQIQQVIDLFFMEKAIQWGKYAERFGEVPIGAVVVRDSKIISAGYNTRETEQSSLGHAEIMAIQEACKVVGSWRLEECTLYVTLEPCSMCSGAIVHSRIKRVVFGALDPKGGCSGSIYNLLQEPKFNHYVEVTSGTMEEECSHMISNFFRELRLLKKQNKRNQD